MSAEKSLVVKTVKDLTFDKGGNPIVSNIGEQLIWCQSLLDTGMLPDTYKKASQVMAGMQMAKELGLQGGVKSLSRTAIIRGSVSIWGELPLAICQATGEVEDIIGYHFDKNMKKICIDNKNVMNAAEGYFFSIKRKGFKTPVEGYYTMTQANKAGLSGNVWAKHPDDMLRHRTIAKVLKVAFADKLSGISVAEYDHNTMGSTENPKSNLPITENEESDLNAVVSDEKPVVVDKIEGAVIVEPEPLAIAETAEVLEPETKQKKDTLDELKEKVKEIQDKEPVKEEPTTDQKIHGAYMSPLGVHKGKKMEEISIGDLKETAIKIAGHLESNGRDATAASYLQGIKDYLKVCGHETTS